VQVSVGMMPPRAERAVRDALATIGYSDVQKDYSFSLGSSEGGPEVAPASLVAFWQEPHDQFGSAVAVRWLADGYAVDPYLRAVAEGLWAPYTILATPAGCQIWETLPTAAGHGEIRFPLLEDDLAYDGLARVLAKREQQLGPQAVADRKRRWRQMALYEASPEPNAFLEWAYRPTHERIADVFSRLLRATRELAGPNRELDAGHLRWLLRMVGVRIAWDKRWLEPTGRTSSRDLLLAALRYPTRVRRITDLSDATAQELADLVAAKLGPVHLGAADGGLLSQIIQGSGLPDALKREWKLYLTPPDVAWNMLKSLPIAALPEGQRRVWDGTCGSGTILVAALEHLRALVPHRGGADLRSYLISAMAGNEREPALADATRIALDLALGAPAGPEWWITIGDVEAASPTWGEGAPTIIASNPPFSARGRTPDLALRVIGRYLDILPPGGLLSVIAPRSMLATEAASALRGRLLEGFNLFEVSELPAGAFPQTDTETAVLVARKRYRAESGAGAVTWRRFGPDRRQQSLEAVSQGDWLSSPRKAIQPPLAVGLQSHLKSFPRLAEYVPKDRRTQGITPGKLARKRGDVLRHPESATEPYLTGRTGMLPFYIAWERDPAWIRYRSPHLQWPRRSYEQLFRSPKVLVSRHATRGATWRVRAAVDDRGLFPSDQFLALQPNPPLSREFLAGLLNSAFANGWLRLVNPAFSARLEEILALPVPDDLESDLTARVERIARDLAGLRERLDEGVEGVTAGRELLAEAKALTLSLDSAVYDILELPAKLRHDLAEYLRGLGGKRPGFDEPLVAVPSLAPRSPSEIFGDEDAERMNALFASRDERQLSAAEEDELARLVDRWQEAHLLASTDGGSNGARGRYAESASSASPR
jgi:hypothetical protein